MNLMNKHFLLQYVQQPTRLQNILDLFLTDDANFVQLIQIEDISYREKNKKV